MPRPTEPVKGVCYADDITVWASEVQIPVLEQQINSYLEELSTFLKDNSLLISAPKSTVTLFTPDPFQARFLSGPTSTYDEAHPLLQASHHHRWQTLTKSRSRQSTQRLSPSQEGNRQSIEYYAIDHLTSAKLRLHSEDRKGQLSPSFARVIAIC